MSKPLERPDVVEREAELIAKNFAIPIRICARTGQERSASC